MPNNLLSDGLFDDVGVIMLEGVIMLVDMLVVVYTVVVGCSPIKKFMQSKIFCNLTRGRW